MKQNEEIRKEIDLYYENWFKINYAYSSWAQSHGTSENMILSLYEIASAKDGCTQQSLCRKLLLPKQTISFILHKLEKQGFLFRKENPHDRRNKLVFLTEEGKAYADDVLTKLEQAEIKAYQSMTAAQRKTVTQGLRMLADALSEQLCPK